LPVKEQMRSSSGATLVIYRDVILYSGLVAAEKGDHTTVFGLSLKDGKTLWKAAHPPCGHMGTPDDILVANGLVWWGAVAGGKDSGTMTSRDPQTGSLVKEYPCDGNVPWFHHRCYRAKATDSFLLFSRTGIEYIDTASGHWTPNNWVRGGCLYGVMPANGMTYVTPHPCACYEEAKLYGFTALAPAAKTPPVAVPEDTRLEQGPAYGAITALPAAAGEWPTYRHDQARSGSTTTPVPIELRNTWQTSLGGKLSSVVVAEGKLFVASVETATIHALDADTGKLAWSYIAGGRIDSPPTIWQGAAIFGCTDGYIYCLRASDGVLAWRYHAAPATRQMVAYDKLESVWPVSGSVLVQDGVVFSVAGRSMFLDSGLRLVRLDAKSGRKLSETVLDDRDPATQQSLQSKATGMNMPVALPDILSCDGRNVYMRSLPFDLRGNRKFVEYVRVTDQQGDDIHLFSPTGFLDDSMWHRTYWIYGRAWASAASGYYQAGRLVPAGRIMVFDDKTVWGYGRRWQYYKWSTPYTYHLFATSKQPEVIKMTGPSQAKKVAPKKKPNRDSMTRFGYNWSDDLPVQVVSMVHTGPTIFVAGPPAIMDEEQVVQALDDPKLQARAVEQSAAYEGRKGAVLAAVSASDGKALVSYRLPSAPIFDSLAAAVGRLYFSTMDGKVFCLGGDKGTSLSIATDVTASRRSPDADKPPSTSATKTAPERKKRK
jgi:outer membrane protein assembly factor BamB